MTTVVSTPGPRPWFHAPQTWIARLAAHPDWLAALTLLFLVALLWVPFGLNVGFVSDGWNYYFEVDQSSMIELPLRPFTSVAWRIAYLFSPNSFVGVNLFLAALIYTKALLVHRICAEMGVRGWFATSVAVLTVIYPADTAVFWLGTLQVHFALACLALAIWALVRYWKNHSLLNLPIIWIPLGLALGIYEVAFLIAGISPLLLLILNPQVSRRFLRVSALWYVIPSIAGVRYVFLLLQRPSSSSYQDGLLALPISLTEIVQSVELVLSRHFGEAWIVRNVGPDSGFVILSTLAALVVSLVIGRLLLIERSSRMRMGRRTYAITFGAGIAVMIVGYLPFLVTLLRTSTERTFFYTSIGASLIIVSLVSALLISWLNRPMLYAGMIGLLVWVGMYGQLRQHRAWVDHALRQQEATVALFETIERLTPSSTLVVIDDSEHGTHRSLFGGSWYASNIITYISRDYSLRAVLCYPEQLTYWNSYRERCEFDIDEFRLLMDDTPMHTTPYDSVVLVRHLGDNQYVIEPDLSRLGITSDAYDPFRLIDPSAPPPERLRTLFGIEAGA